MPDASSAAFCALLIFRPLPFILFPADAARAAARLLPRAILYSRASLKLVLGVAYRDKGPLSARRSPATSLQHKRGTGRRKQCSLRYNTTDDGFFLWMI